MTELAATEAQSVSCAHCGNTIRRITGTLTEWWVHVPGGQAFCSPWQPARSTRATPQPAVEAHRPQAAFFQPGRTYTREHHGDTIRFLVRHVSEAPDGSYRVAFGWRLNADGDWEPTDSDDITGWTSATAAPPCDGCGHPEHPARKCPVTLYGERCACDEPITAAGARQDGAQK